MNEGAVRLEKAMKSAGHLSARWGLLRPVEEDDEFAADFGSIKKVYESAKRVLTPAAIVNLLQNVSPKGLVDATKRLT